MTHSTHFVADAMLEDRVLLTRDRHLLWEPRPARAWAVESETPLVQLVVVVADPGPDSSRYQSLATLASSACRSRIR